MAWVETVSEDRAEGLLAEVYRADRDQFGFVQNLTEALSLKPKLFRRTVGVEEEFHYGRVQALASPLCQGGRGISETF